MCIRDRRRWEDPETGQTYSRDWNLLASGTRITAEFGAFLKDVYKRQGISDYAQEQLGDIVFVDITTEGETLEKGEVFGTIEVVKTISDPVSYTHLSNLSLL